MAEIEKDISGKDHDNQNKQTKIVTRLTFPERKVTVGFPLILTSLLLLSCMGTVAPDMEVWSSGSFSPGLLYPSISWVLANVTQTNYFCILCL